MLQNIDDAIGPKEQKKYIGTKGLGFLSVMEVANNPAIFSNGFHFTFSKERTKIALLDEGLDTSLAELAPNFQVPWPVKSDEFASDLLKHGFETVIKLELRSDSIEDIKKSLQSLDHHFLLFSQNLKELRIKVDELSYCYSKYVKVLSKEENSQKCHVKVICTQGEKNRREEEWVLWRRDWTVLRQMGVVQVVCLFYRQKKVSVFLLKVRQKLTISIQLNRHLTSGDFFIFHLI